METQPASNVNLEGDVLKLTDDNSYVFNSNVRISKTPDKNLGIVVAEIENDTGATQTKNDEEAQSRFEASLKSMETLAENMKKKYSDLNSL